MKILKFILTCTMFLTFQTSLMAAITADKIASTMETKINSITALLKQSKDKKSVTQKIYDTIDNAFDYNLMAKLSLGQNQFKMLKPNEQKIFTQKFEQRLKDSFVEKLNLYSDETVKILHVKDVKSRKILSTELVGKDKKFAISYKFYDAKEKGWLIYDVDILGISVVQTYRNQFANILESKTFDELLTLLQNTKPAQTNK